MNKNTITRNQYMFIILGNMIGIGVAFLGAESSYVAHQDAWISTFICGIYPIIIVICAYLIDKNSNHDDFWEMLKKVYTKPIAYCIITIFLIYYFIMFTTVVAGFTNILTQTITDFLSPYYIIIPSLLIITFITMKGIYMIGRVCELYFYLIVLFVAVLIFLLPNGSLNNIQPMFSTTNNIAKGALTNLSQYSLVEISFITISKVTNNKKLLKAGILSCLITIVIYTFIVFLLIFNLGWELTSKVDFPLLYMIGTVSTPVVANFTSLYTFLWGIIFLNNISCSSYFVSYCISSSIKIDYKKACIIASLIVLFASYFMLSEHNRIAITEEYISYFIYFSLGFGIITSILVPIRYRRTLDEKS
ncbi:MAG: spore germination protein [Vallitalea sp.]|nr:spore germination protein [Vallitalea sp.]